MAEGRFGEPWHDSEDIYIQTPIKGISLDELEYAPLHGKIFYNENHEIVAFNPGDTNYLYVINDIIVPQILPYLKIQQPQIRLGADIELEINFLTKEIIIPARRTPYRSLTNIIGADGAGMALEIRPPPARSPEGITNNIRAVLNKIKLHKRLVRCVSNRQPLGGHIHISLGINGWSRINLYRDSLAKLLDFFVGWHFALHEPYKMVRWDRYGYGMPWEKNGDAVRISFIHDGIEYRTPSSFLIHSEQFCYLTFKIIYKTVEFWLRHAGETIEKPYLAAKAEDYQKYLGLSRGEAEAFISAFRQPIENYDKDVRELWNLPIKKSKIMEEKARLAAKIKRDPTFDRVPLDSLDSFLGFIRRSGLDKDMPHNIIIAESYYMRTIFVSGNYLPKKVERNGYRLDAINATNNLVILLPPHLRQKHLMAFKEEFKEIFRKYKQMAINVGDENE